MKKITIMDKKKIREIFNDFKLVCENKSDYEKIDIEKVKDKIVDDIIKLNNNNIEENY
jgi:hypothetical protein